MRCLHTTLEHGQHVVRQHRDGKAQQRGTRMYLNVFVCNRAAYDWYWRIGFVEIENDGKVSTLALAPSPSPAHTERHI